MVQNYLTVLFLCTDVDVWLIVTSNTGAILSAESPVTGTISIQLFVLSYHVMSMVCSTQGTFFVTF